MASLPFPEAQGPLCAQPGINSNGNNVVPRIIPCADACPRDPGRGEDQLLCTSQLLSRLGRDSRSIQPEARFPHGAALEAAPPEDLHFIFLLHTPDSLA